MAFSILAFAVLVSVWGADGSAAKFQYTDGGLPVGELNLLVLTDLHGWLGGHRYNKDRMSVWGQDNVSDATYGDVYSAFDDYKEQYKKKEKKLFIVMNGDFFNGTGLSCHRNELATSVSHITFDAFVTGGQELVYANNQDLEFLKKKLYRKTLVTSNVMQKNTTGSTRLGEPYLNLSNWLVLGFLDDNILSDKPPTNLIDIRPIEDALNETWLIDAIKVQEWKGVLVLCHMSRDSPSVMKIAVKVRTLYGDQYPDAGKIPMIFATSYKKPEDTVAVYAPSDDQNMTFVIQAGKDLDTIGLVAYAEDQKKFASKFIQARNDALQTYCTGDCMYNSTNGRITKKEIEHWQKKFHLKTKTRRKLDETYYTSPQDGDKGLNEFYVDTVVGEVFRSTNSCLVHPRSAFRSSAYLPGDNVSLMCDDIFSVMNSCGGKKFSLVAQNMSFHNIFDVEKMLNSNDRGTVWYADKFCKDENKTNLSLVTIEDEVQTVNGVLQSLNLTNGFTVKKVFTRYDSVTIWWAYLHVVKKNNNQQTKDNVRFIVILFSVVGAVVLIAVALYLRQILYRTKSPYRLVNGITSLDDDDDDEDDAMVPAYHKQAGRVELPDFGKSTASDVTGL